MTTASYETVKAHLMFEWIDEEDTETGEVREVRGEQLMANDEAVGLLVKHKAILDKGIRLRSNAYYVAGEIIHAEGK